jgi:hypothetical protein
MQPHFYIKYTTDYMRKLFFAAVILSLVTSCDPAKRVTTGTRADGLINAAEVERIEKILSADDMQGRKAGTPGIDKAAAFIESEFKSIGLETFGGLKTYRQEFTMISPKHVATTGTIGNAAIDVNNVIVISSNQK